MSYVVQQTTCCRVYTGVVAMLVQWLYMYTLVCSFITQSAIVFMVTVQYALHMYWINSVVHTLLVYCIYSNLHIILYTLASILGVDIYVEMYYYIATYSNYTHIQYMHTVCTCIILYMYMYKLYICTEYSWVLGVGMTTDTQVAPFFPQTNFPDRFTYLMVV